MSQKDGDQALPDRLDRLARESGRITGDRLTCRGLNAANRLIKQDRACTGEHTADSRWELFPASTGDSPEARP